ncbi:adenylate/guanylate cyclase domain-containing protein [Pontibacter pamirensis]|uniref:adenylate/guanylate cyclase domain-containing protein n=1 Tax=Pontibacter pamirensis TaxID=2562824 RepID=UPI0013899234|nr:adenylate/guanylate cyclase domain-containing protein [Pontibacter pamirensis]
MSRTRQLAAIMFTDIVGYTALMGDDEQKALDLLDKNRTLQQSLIQKFGGRWIKELGDGVLASFPNAADAVHCAISIQQGCTAIPGLTLRIGIHSGDVMFEYNDVFGDSVNIAARLQTLAPIGGTWISEQVYKSIANYKDIDARLVGKETLKHVKEPIRVYEVQAKNKVAEPAKSTLPSKEQAKAAPPKSIAVLAFVNMSNDPEQEYFSDGMAEEIINSLQHLQDLKVAGRTSSFQFKGKNIDLREVGEKLGVNSVLEGSVRKYGDRLRITAQLIDVADGFHLWSEKYDRNMDDVFAIQDEIALAITEQLKVTLLGSDREKIIKTSTQNTRAYELYLKGRFYTNRRGSSILPGLEYFKQAIALDPKYALAYAGYADANILMAFYSFSPGKEALKEVKSAAEMAIKLDETLGEPYCALAMYYLHYKRNWNEVRKNHIKAINLNPNYAQSHSWYGMNLLNWIEGNFEEAEKEGQLAIRLEPLSAIDHADYAWTLYTGQKYNEALNVAQKGIDLDNSSFLSHRIAGLCYLALERYEEAVNTFSFLMTTSNRHQHAVNSLIWAYCANGHIRDARALMQELEQRSTTEYIAGTYAGVSAAHLGDIETALTYLEHASQDRDPIVIQLKYSPFVPALLRDNAEFQNLLERIGFPEQ